MSLAVDLAQSSLTTPCGGNLPHPLPCDATRAIHVRGAVTIHSCQAKSEDTGRFLVFPSSLFCDLIPHAVREIFFFFGLVIDYVGG